MISEIRPFRKINRKKTKEISVGKIKVGGNPINEDVSRVEAIRKIVGKSRQLSADANQSWERTEAIRFVEGVSGLLDFIEQPVMGNDLDGMKSIAQASSTPIGADEGLHSISDIVSHKESGAAAGGSLKMIKLGGVMKALTAAELSDQVGMKVNLAGKICETSIASAAVSHLAATIPQIDWGLSITNQYAATDIVKEPISILNGNVSVPSGYGLGVEMDEVSLIVYDLMGKEVATLVSGTYAPGRYQVEWDAVNNMGDGIVSGMYIYRYLNSKNAIIRKMLYLK